MSYPKQIDDHQHSSFDVNENNESMRRVFSGSGTSVNPLAKFVAMTETSTTVETYKYYESSNMVTLYNTIIVTYTTSTKDVLASVAWE